MKSITIVTCLVLVTSMLYSQTSSSPKDSVRTDIGVHIGLGMMEGNDYSNLLSDAGASGYLGWINLEGGFEFRVWNKLYLGPRLSLIASRVKTTWEGIDLGSTKVNLVFLPGIAAKYYLFDGNSPYASLYLNSIASISMETFEKYDFASNGIATGFALGYQLIVGNRRLMIEAGVANVPIEVNKSIQNNFGGFFINVLGYWSIANY